MLNKPFITVGNDTILITALCTIKNKTVALNLKSDRDTDFFLGNKRQKINLQALFV